MYECTYKHALCAAVCLVSACVRVSVCVRACVRVFLLQCLVLLIALNSG